MNTEEYLSKFVALTHHANYFIFDIECLCQVISSHQAEKWTCESMKIHYFFEKSSKIQASENKLVPRRYSVENVFKVNIGSCFKSFLPHQLFTPPHSVRFSRLKVKNGLDTSLLVEPTNEMFGMCICMLSVRERVRFWVTALFQPKFYLRNT